MRTLRRVSPLRLVGLADKAKESSPRDLSMVELRKLEHRRRAMAAEPKLLIADEAMAGLSHSEVDDILALLARLSERASPSSGSSTSCAR